MAFDPDRQIIVVESGAAADAAAEILDMVVVPFGEAGGPDRVDWSEMSGCRLVMWATAGQAGVAAMQLAATLVHAAGAASVKFVDPGPLKDEGWDAASAAAEGWERDDLLEWLRQRAVAWVPPVVDHDAPDPASYGAVPPEPPAAAQPPDIRTEAEITGRAPPDMVSAPRRTAVPAPPEPHQPAPQARGVAFDPHAPMVDKWAQLGLDYGKAGCVANEDNVMRVLQRHPEYVQIVWFDEFLGRIMTKDGDGVREWADADVGHLAVALQRDLGMSRVKVHHVKTAVMTFAYANMKNCAQDWLRSLKWDGIERIAAFFPDHCGAVDDDYSRATGRNFFISMAARVLQPGCKVDNMVVLEGSQGTGKSSMLKALGGDWYTVQHEAVTGKGFFEVLQGKMLVEIAEMDAFGKAEVTRVKQVVSTETDRYRAAYGHYAQDHKRHSVFAGSCNVDDWNRDPTGARRFWPIRVVGNIDIAAIRKARGQLFAEAVAAYDAGASWWVMPEIATKAEQDARREDDPWSASVAEWLKDIYRTRVTVEEVLRGAIELRKVEMGRPQHMRAAAILRDLGWTKCNSGGKRYWERPESAT